MKRGQKRVPKTTRASPKKSQHITPEALIEQGNVALSNMQPELACQFFKRALELTPENTNIMDALADAFLQTGEQEGALHLLLESTSRAPAENPYKWCYLAQLQCGPEALASYLHGIELLGGLLSSESDDTVCQLLRKQIAKAQCSIAELYLTDLCYDEKAESNCEEAIQLAFAVDEGSLDALQALASFRLSQNRQSEASTIMKDVFTRIITIREAFNKRTVIEEIVGAPDLVDMQDLPESEFCVTTAKLLIECAVVEPSHGEDAMQLIEDLLMEDDENVELWYMMGVAALGLPTPDLESARFHLERAKAMLDDLLKQFEENGAVEAFPFADQYRLTEEHLKILADKERECGVDPSTYASAGDENDMALEDVEQEEEWSSCDEEEEES